MSKRKGRIMQRVMPLPAALGEHPDATLFALWAVWNTATQCTVPEAAQRWTTCFRCARPWSTGTWPVVMLLTEYLAGNEGGHEAVAYGVCGQCCDQGRPAMEDALRMAAERFGAVNLVPLSERGEA